MSDETPIREPYRRNQSSAGEGQDLPADKTCGDCAHFARCRALIGRIVADEICDWSPGRFLEKMTK